MCSPQVHGFQEVLEQLFQGEDSVKVVGLTIAYKVLHLLYNTMLARDQGHLFLQEVM